MRELRKMKISEFAEVIGGGTPSTKVEAYYGGTIPWLTPRDLTNYKFKRISKGERNITENGLKNSSAKLIPKNSILLTSRAPIGYLAIADNEICTNQGFKSLVVNPDLADYNFVYYLLISNIDLLKSFGTGTTFAEISGNVVKNIEFDLPELPTQKAIAEILSSLDDKIELNNQINQNLEAFAQALFKQWFVDFEFPNESGGPYKSSGGEMVDSELGEVPKGWRIKLVRELNPKLETGKRPKGGVNGIDSGTPSVGAESIKGLGYFDYSKTKFVSKEFSSLMNKGWVNGFEILIYKDGGKPGTFIPNFNMFGEGFPFEELVLNEHVFLLDFRSKDQNCFGYFFFDSDYVRPMLANSGGKAAIPGINQGDINSLKIFDFEIPEVKKFGEVSQSIISSILKNCKENENLRNLRDTLLPKLISGELEVNESLLEPTF